MLCIVPMGGAKGKCFQIYTLGMWIDPLEQKFYADPKNGLKKFHTIPEGPKFFDWTFGGEWPYKFLKLYGAGQVNH